MWLLIKKNVIVYWAISYFLRPSEKHLRFASNHWLPNFIEWRCELYDKAWGVTVHKIRKGDFCSKQGFLRDYKPIFPSYNKNIFPVVTYFFRTYDYCVIEMALGADAPQNIRCINGVVHELKKNMNGKEKWIIYSTHGLFANDFTKRYNTTMFGRSSSKHSRKVIREKRVKWHNEYASWIRDLKMYFSTNLRNR